MTAPTSPETHICPYCKSVLVEGTRPWRVSRGDRWVEVDRSFLRCPQDHPDDDGEQPYYAIVDSERSEANLKAVLAAWRERYSEELPPPAKAGRKPAEDPRHYRVPVLLTRSELKAVDAERGETSRSEYLRRRAFG